MKNKKIYILFIVILIIILIGGFGIIKYLKNKESSNDKIEEYIPEEEITEEQERKTIITLYFPSKENKELLPEARMINIKEIIDKPWEKLINLLIEGPKNDKSINIIPEGTKILKTELNEDCLLIDFSSEFLKYDKAEEKNKEILIEGIVKTVAQLNEINTVKILIDGKENNEFAEIYTLNK